MKLGQKTSINNFEPKDLNCWVWLLPGGGRVSDSTIPSLEDGAAIE